MRRASRRARAGPGARRCPLIATPFGAARLRPLWLLLFLAVGCVRTEPTATPTVPAPTPVPTATPRPCPSLQALVDAAAPGARVRVPPCTFREAVEVSRPITLVAEPGAEIRGSDVWSDGWSARGGRWERGGLPTLERHGECQKESPRCRWPEQVFVDGRPLLQVAADPGPGQFAVAGDRVILGEDPSGRLVEVSTRTSWVVGPADGVTVEGFAMLHAANSAQRGAIDNRGGSRWVLRGNRLSDSHGPAVSFNGGSDHELIGNDISRSGQLGVHGNQARGVVVRGNEIRENNTEGFDPRWEAGGLKMTEMADLTVSANEVSRNAGVGLWCDIGCRDVTFSGNRVHHNAYEGIIYEISRAARISGNLVWENGWAGRHWGFGAGIICQNCADSEVVENVVAWNGGGIAVLEQDREIVDTVNDVTVRGNTIVCAPGARALVWLADSTPRRIFRSGARNRGVENRVGCAGDDAFSWDGRDMAMEAFARTPGGAGTRPMAGLEVERVLALWGLPARPG